MLFDQDMWELPEDQRMHSVANAFEAAYSTETTADAITLAEAEAGGEAISTGKGGGWEVLATGEVVRRRHPLVPAILDAALLRSLWTLYRRQFLSAGCVRFLNSSVQFLPAIFVQRLLR